MKAPAAGEHQTGTVGGRALRLLIACTQCGGPCETDVDAVSVSCPHCGSFLVVTHPGRESFFVSQSLVSGVEDVRKTVVLYRVQSHRAELVARHGTEREDGTIEPPSEDFILRKLRDYEQRLLERLTLRDVFRFHAPYWHLSGTILQGILGREHDGPKQLRVRAFAVEHTVPGYDEAESNLRDRGLRLSGARLRPLTRALVAELRTFLPWVPVQEATYREIQKWQTRDLDPGIEAVAKHGSFVPARRVLVYRPYWIARVVAPGEDALVLVDGGFGTLAGNPDAEEARALRRRVVADPATHEPSETHAVVRPPRCPDCGADQQIASDARVAICTNCHLALEPLETGLRVLGYDHGEWGRGVPLDGPYLPFWTFPFTLAVEGAPVASRLEDYARIVFPQAAPPGFAPRGDRLLLPAFRLLGTEPGDEAFAAITESLHREPPAVREGKVPLGGRPACHDVTVSLDDARALAPTLLFALHGRPSAARLNAMSLKRAVAGAKLTLGAGRLLMLPFEAAGSSVKVPGREVGVGRLLLERSPELEGMRATVYAPRPCAQGAAR